MIVVCAQECKKKYKQQRLHELEQYFAKLNFIHLEFVSMWEMWLVCFIKRKYAPQVTKIRNTYIAKGIGNMIGNKGGVAQSFMIQNRLFNFIAVHLKHGQNKSHKRNDMASELIKEMKLQTIQ